MRPAEYLIPADAPRPTYASQCQVFSYAKKDHPQLKIPQLQVLQHKLFANSQKFGDRMDGHISTGIWFLVG
ncbi:hypothetical protein [Geitlerinema sp. PCC 9228]|jgi:hypothetical protein|uniref:hypothetical protein n=1 Tax=Geitlerinema sp. PCC 9228 TaxID=111611 RepID=UPI0008F9AB83|nr:hypothetical protein [Geitlerinema sp. PCC 9228]